MATRGEWKGMSGGGVMTSWCCQVPNGEFAEDEDEDEAEEDEVVVGGRE